MLNLCQRQQRKLYVPFFERNDIPVHLHSFHTLHMKAALKQKKVLMFVAFFRGTVWLNRS
jgi:hypothetical protein